METAARDNGPVLVDAIYNGIIETQEVVAEIGDNLLECANKLRIEQSEAVFTGLSAGFDDLTSLIDFVGSLNRGLDELSSGDGWKRKLLCWDKTLSVFEEMHASFEREDWITLSDLIEYELRPLLQEGSVVFSEIQKGMEKEYQAA